MFRQIDRSHRLSRTFQNITAGLASRRGLLPVLGVLLIIISFVVHLLGLALPHPAFELIWSITHHVGLIMALIGILLIEPLGR
jgi:hypothetical protein